MRLYPAIDIKDGQCVRLKKGLFNDVTVYSDKPYEIARGFEQDGAKFIHTVDLDGALKGRGVNADTIDTYAGLRRRPGYDSGLCFVRHE